MFLVIFGCSTLLNTVTETKEVWIKKDKALLLVREKV